MAQATNAAITTVPQYLKTAIAALTEKASKKRDNEDASAAFIRPASNNVKPRLASGSTQAAASTDAQPKKRKQGTRSDTEPPSNRDRGMFILKNPSMEMGKVFPSDLSQKLCAAFMCKGKECTRPRGQCAFLHHARPADLVPADLNAIVAKFRADGTGWLNKHVFTGFQLNPCQALLLGDANGFGQTSTL
jgi:hypothetical protein